MLTPRILLFCAILLCGITTISYPQNPLDSLKNLVSTTEGKDQIRAQYELVNRLVNISPQETQRICREMIKNSEALDYREGQAMAYHILGASYNLLSKLDSAILILEEGLTISETIDDKIHEGRIILALSASYLRDYQLSKAQKLLQRSLIIAESLDNKNMEMTGLMNMAIVNTYLKEMPEAEANLLKALAISEEQGAVMRSAQIYGNLGNLEFDRSNFSLSKDYFLKALVIFQERSIQQMVSIVQTQLGRCYAELGELEKALGQFDQALTIRQQTGDTRGMASVLRYKSQSLFELRRFTEVEALLTQALDLNEKVRDPFISMDLAELGYRLYEAKGAYEKALDYHKQYTVFKDTIDARNERQEVKRLTAEFDQNQLLKALENERQNKEIAELKKRERDLLIVLLAVFLVGIIALYRLNRSRVKKQMIISEHEKSLLNEKLVNQRSKIDQIESELSSLEAEYSETTETKEALINYLSGARVEGKDWASFKLLFDKVYPETLASLQPHNLTLSDQRLIALTILGLSIKEIASVLGITPKSVSKARARLTVKLGLSDTKNLDPFISSLIKVQNPPED